VTLLHRYGKFSSNDALYSSARSDALFESLFSAGLGNGGLLHCGRSFRCVGASCGSMPVRCGVREGWPNKVVSQRDKSLWNGSRLLWEHIVNCPHRRVSCTFDIATSLRETQVGFQVIFVHVTMGQSAHTLPFKKLKIPKLLTNCTVAPFSIFLSSNRIYNYGARRGHIGL